MKLIDRIMRDICDVMKWQGWPDAPTEAGTWAGDIRIMLTPRCDAADAVVEACRKHRKPCGPQSRYSHITFIGDMLNDIDDALAALDEVRDE